MELAKNFKVLSDEDIYRVHMEVLEVLWQIGIMVEDKESLKILEKNGAKINYELKRAYLPNELVKHTLDIMSGSYGFYDVEGKKCFQFGGFDSTYATAGYFTSIVDKDGIEHQGT